MKKLLSLILAIVLVFGIAASPALALTTDEINGNIGDNWETICVVDMGKHPNITSVSGSTPEFVLTGLSGENGYSDGNVTYPRLVKSAASISKSDIIKKYPHLENNSMNDSYLKWDRNLASAMFRLKSIFPQGTIKNGEVVRISVEICLTDVVPYVNADGSDVPVNNSIIDHHFFQISVTSSGDTKVMSANVPINQWTTINGYFKASNDAITGIKFDPNINGTSIDCVKTPFPKTAFIGRIIFEKIRGNNQPLESNIKYTEDFERYTDSEKKFSIDGTNATNNTGVTDKYLELTPMATADVGVLGESQLTYKDSANPNDITKYAIGSNGDYKYVYPTTGTAQGKYHLFGDASLGDTGVRDASFGIGYSDLKHITSANNHLSAADRLDSSTKKRSVITPVAHSGRHMLVASGFYNKNASVRFNNIYGSHPVASDVGKKFRASFYVYPDSKMGAYESGTTDYASATPVVVDTSKPVSITVSNNSPLGNIYKYSSSYSETAVATYDDIPWDQWSKIEFICETTTESIDDLQIDINSNSLRNSLQISQFEAEEQIADTLYFDDFSIEEIDAGTQAKFTAYLFDGAYDVSAIITSTTIASESSVQLVVAEYEQNSGRLLAIYTSLPKTFNFATVPVSVSISGIKPISSNNTMRAFLIDSYTGLCPYISPANVGSIYEEIE